MTKIKKMTPPMIFSDLILASKSPRRADIMKAHGADFSVYAADVAELSNCSDLKNLPVLNAELKAAAVAELFPEKTVIGADTVIFFENSIIGKPSDIDDARKILKLLAGRKHQVITGCAVICKKKNICDSFAVVSEVFFKQLSDSDIDNYLSKVYVLDKAGAYAIQEYGELIIEKYTGSLENIIGFPWDEISEHLTALK